MSNRLSLEKSPYLLQHAQNPVDWYPWGDEAFRKAQEEDKPIFLSVGYATCHWCHVMEHESFEDEEVAGLLNEHMVSIKVDREERPDIDQIYMTVCQALTGRGGWPLSVFMTPDRKPFFAGTYFPKRGRMGMTGFMEIIEQLSAMWRNDRGRILQVGEQLTQAIQPRRDSPAARIPGVETLDKGFQQLAKAFDATWGGFSRAPKFPTPHQLTFLLRYHRRKPGSGALDFVEKTLDGMRNGGIFDHVGYGFSRYSVDEKWLVPHFEKMLYDQALLAMAYLEAYQVTGHTRHGRVAREIFHYVLRDMTSPEGGFYSAEDADSEGREGLFYVWKPGQVREVLGEEDGRIFCRFFDITDAGNFEDHWSIPHVSRTVEAMAPHFGMNPEALEALLERGRQKLFEVREKRIHPLKDDKILTAWNGLMIAALAKGSTILKEPAYADAARRAADFILQRMRSPSGRLYRRFREGDVAHRAYADDHALFIWGLIELHQATLQARYLEEAFRLQLEMIRLFWDDEDGGFFFSAEDNESLIVRDKEIYDGAVPSSNSVAVFNLLRLARLTGNTELEERADRCLRAFAGMVEDYPSAYTQFLNAVDFAAGPTEEIVIAGDGSRSEVRDMLRTVQSSFVPHRVVIVYEPDSEEGRRLVSLAPFLENMRGLDGHPAAYVCRGGSCRQPVSAVEALREILEES